MDCQFDIISRLAHQMKSMTEGLTDMRDFLSRRSILQLSVPMQHRQQAVSWIKEVCAISKSSSAARDLSVQIFDKFYIRHLTNNTNMEEQYPSLPIIAATSFLLGAKMDTVHLKLKLANFGQFRTSDLKDWEQHILCTIDFEIEPQLTPTAFVASLLCVWATDVDKSAIAATADGLIAEFLEVPDYWRFAPSTIAFSSLLLSFLHLGIDCIEWLRYVPEFLIPSGSHRDFVACEEGREPLDAMLDVDSCLKCFQVLMSSRSKPLPPSGAQCSTTYLPSEPQTDPCSSDLRSLQAKSPTSIAEAFDDTVACL